MRKNLIKFLVATMLFSAAAAAVAKTGKANPESIGFWTMPTGAAQLEREAHAALDHARALMDQIVAVKGNRTVQNTLVPYSEIDRYITLPAMTSYMLENAHPDESMREASRKVSQEAQAFRTQVQLDPRIYHALADLKDSRKLDSQASFYLDRTLNQFRTAGADKTDDVRRQIASLRAEIVKLEQQFNQNITNGPAWQPFRAAELEGVPGDFLNSRQRDAGGNVLISNDQSETVPVVGFAKNPETRHRVQSALQNRGFPANTQVLGRLIALRRQLANLCGFRTYADMNVRDRMVGSEAGERRFLDELDTATLEVARQELAILLEAKRRDQPDATSLESWDWRYYAGRVTEQKYAVKAGEMRDYTPYAGVKDGVLQIAARMFNISFRPVKTPVWRQTVEVFDVVEKGNIIGRIYLDMFVRANKSPGAMTAPIRLGLAGLQKPEVALICSMQQPSEKDPALMGARQVITFLHEFGHLLHAIFSGSPTWRLSPEPDFMEVPSQLFEEWFRNPKVLAIIARHYITAELLPESLIERFEKSDNFGAAVNIRTQLFYSNISLAYESGAGPIDTSAIAREMAPKYSLFKLPEGDHPECSFIHLGTQRYAGAYYTYQWSLVIAKDLFTKFNRDDLLDPKVAARYRKLVLEPGGSRPAAKLIEDFLGRPFNLKAYQAWLQSY